MKLGATVAAPFTSKQTGDTLGGEERPLSFEKTLSKVTGIKCRVADRFCRPFPRPAGAEGGGRRPSPRLRPSSLQAAATRLCLAWVDSCHGSKPTRTVGKGGKVLPHEGPAYWLRRIYNQPRNRSAHAWPVGKSPSRGPRGFLRGDRAPERPGPETNNHHRCGPLGRKRQVPSTPVLMHVAGRGAGGLSLCWFSREASQRPSNRGPQI